MPVKAVVFDAYGTLVRNEGLRRIPQRIVADHGLSARAEDVFDAWIDRYSEATQRPPFRTLREIQPEILGQVLHSLGVDADAAPYVELFFEATTKVELYPEVPEVLRALGAVRTALERLGLEAHEVLHVGDSDVDDVKGAKAAGLRVAWLNREGRPRRRDVPRPDFEIRDLKELPSLL